eukprot:3580049-Heterocapsa_arctica.AAC.1
MRFDLAPSVKKLGTSVAVNISGGTGHPQHLPPTPHTRAPGGTTDTNDGANTRHQGDQHAEGWQTMGSR